MRARGLQLVKMLSSRGCLKWEEGVPGLLVPDDPDLVHMVREDLQTVQAVLRRARAFREQLSVPDPEPFVRFREPKWTAQGCPSCGGRVAEHEFLRCDLCALGAELALAAPEGANSVAEEQVK